MNNIMIRLCTVIMLMMFSMGAGAIDVQIVNDGKFEGGEIAFTQDLPKDGQVTVTFYVTPYSGYTISKKDITVVSTIPTGTAETRAEGPMISKVLELDGDDPEDLSEKRTYTVTVDEGLGVWVQKAEFSNSEGTKGDRADYSGTYFIANGNGYSSTNIANNFYLVPATNSNYATDQPHLTTTKSGQVLNCCWQIVKSGDYYRIIHVADGKYLTANPAYSGTSGNDVGRLRVHLEEMVTPDDNTLFEIKVNSNGGYNIRHKDMADKINNSTTTYLDPAGGNVNGTNLTNARTATTSSGKINVGGGIGYWSDEAAARWRFEDVPQNNTYTYNIVDCSGRIAIKYMTGADQPAAKALSSYTDIPEAIRSPYLNGETVSFYSFSDSYSTPAELLGLLTDENKITATPVNDGANIYVTYTTDHLADRFVKLHGASAFNITVKSKCIYDDSGLTAETTDFSSTTTTKNHLWYFDGDDPYAVQIKNFDTGNLLQFDTTVPALSVVAAPTNKYFIIMDGSTSGAGITNGQMELMAATGDATYYRIANAEVLNIDNSTTTGDASLQVRAYPVSVSTRYHLIDKAGKLIEGNIESESSELGLPDEWKSPLVSEYHYYSTPNQTGDTYAPTGIVNSPFDATDIYVTYDVSDVIDIEGDKTYMLRYLNGQNFKQEKSDKILSGETKAVYPYNNGDFNLYVYGKEQWDEQVGAGASERSRWLWYIESNHNDDKLDHADPYHVVIKSYQDQKIKYEGTDYSGTAYLRTYKPNGYTSIVTGTTYKNTGGYKDQLPESEREGCLPTDKPTEYMLIGTSLSNVKLVTLNAIDDGTTNERRTVNSFEQYWKNNPTINGDSSKEIPAVLTNKVTQEGRNIVLTPEQKAEIASQGSNWHVYKVWAYSAPWVNNGDAGQTKTKQYHEEEHCLQTISMGTGEFTFEEVSLEPQVILLDNHGWEIVRIPMYRDFGKETQTINTSELSKYDSPMVETNGYHWYPKAAKVTGYHKYTISDPEPKINIYTYGDDPSTTEVKDVWYIGESVPYSSSSLATTPDGNLSGYSEQAIKYKTDFYVTYTVEDTYARNYQGAATEEAVVPSSYLLKQGGNYATFSGSGTEIGTVATKPSRESVTDELLWNLKPNFKIDEEMGFVYGTGDASKSSIESAYYAAGQNGFDPYNVQIQSKAYPLRYFTTNTTGSALNGGAWEGTSSTTVTLQNLGRKYTATGYDQTTLNITNATFMVVSDGNGNMRLMPRFDNSKVMQSFGTLAAPAAAASAGDQGTGTQTLYIELVADAKEIHSSTEITDLNGNYLLAEDFSFASGFTSLGTSTAPFTGTIDGQMNTFEGLTVPLVAYANGAIIRNIIIKGATISSGNTEGDAGAICCKADGATRIYNCGILPTKVERDSENKITGFSGSSVSGGNNVGGIVGFLDGTSRVINCYSYANITGGSVRAGIVGYNNYASKYDDLKTMVMNCMFYGDIDVIDDLYPIYGGNIINNDYTASNTNRLNNYNYFLYEAPYSEARNIPAANYNCALAAEERFLVRFEFYRHLLNSTRELAAWYATGDVANGFGEGDNNKMAKWVLDKSIAPYPILKPQGFYPSIVNYDTEYTFVPEYNSTTGLETKKLRTAVEKSNQGMDLGKTLSVTISSTKSTGGQSWPTGANIETTSLTLPRIDKDTLNYNFNYDKVQLPYYNEVGKGNYTGKRVVTGWKITGFTGGSQGGRVAADFTTTTNYDAPNYNFADRDTYAKDLYSISGRVFAQGAYFNVPKDVTGITIEPYWAVCTYLSDQNYDGYGYGDGGSLEITSGSTKLLSTRFSNNTDYPISGSGQKVYTSASNAVSNLSGVTSPTVYDYAVVLVGNYHACGTSEVSSGDTPFTIMSIDNNHDNEPDYSLIFKSAKNQTCSPIRYDFINVPAASMAHKMASSTDLAIPGNCFPKGWYEVTTTGIIRFGQLEYGAGVTSLSPLILMGGVVEQIVSTNNSGNSNKKRYLLFGDNVWFKRFANGVHGDQTASTPHRPISVTGGEYEKFYLTGFFRPDATVLNDNAECYIDGGKFGEVAGAGQEQIDGNVNWFVNHADIDNFFGGGINESKPILGNITNNLRNSRIGLFCGGPKFGNMNTDKTVTTTANGCTFGTYYGAGNGGNAIYLNRRQNEFTKLNYGWRGWITGTYDKSGDNDYRGKYLNNQGIANGYEYEFFAGSSGNVARLYIHKVSLSAAQTNNATSTLTDCTVLNNFYGGGNLGKVKGDIVSLLTNCTVKGNVFGAGQSATVPAVEVFDLGGFAAEGSAPNYNQATGVYEQGTYPAKQTFNWKHVNSISNNSQCLEVDGDNRYIKTTQDLETLGAVDGNVTLTIQTDNGKTTTIGTVGNSDTGNVFGGGEQSSVTGATHTVTVNLKGPGNTNILGNVFGGGDQGEVSGSATVNIMVSE